MPALPIDSTPLRAPNVGGAQRFELLSPARTGVRFANAIDPKHPRKYLYHTATACGGVAVGDVDGDGLPDIYLVSGPEKNRLFRQIGDLRFEDSTEKAGVDGGDAWGVGVAMVDIENDGDLDIYVSNFDTPNQLYLNRGDGTFVESASKHGVDFDGASIMAAFADYDCDGDLDFYLLTNRQIPHFLGIGFKVEAKRHHLPVVVRNGVPNIRAEFEKFYDLERKTDAKDFRFVVRGSGDRLFRNRGDGTFTDATSDLGEHEPDLGLSATWWDYDDDGLPDLYVGNDYDGPDHLYHNEGGGKLRDVIAEACPHTSWFSMGADFGDINNDGRLDFLTADMSATTHFKQKTSMGVMNAERIAGVAGPPPQFMRNALYLNTGTERFLEVAYLAGVADTDWTWSVKFADLDNDGWVDLFATNGAPRDTIHSDLSFDDLSGRLGENIWDAFSKAPPRPEQNLAFRNTGDLSFEDVSASWGLAHVGMSYAAAHADLDRDGDLDLVVVHLGEPVAIYRNGSSEGHRVLIRLHGTTSNRYGIGARVRIETSAGIQVRELMPTRGFTASNEPLVHFGLGEQAIIEKLTIRWPSGHQQTFEKLAADRLYTIVETRTAETTVATPTPKKPARARTMFHPAVAVEGFRHREQAFDDFERQPLLPNKMSRWGPGAAWGDTNGDGRSDLFVGGAAGQSGVLWIDRGGGDLVATTNMPWSKDSRCEDMGAVWIDADLDGDLDLFVASGGVECEPGDPVLGDRLYLNEGSERFRRADDRALPEASESSGPVCAADFDLDGDLDLFVGGRVVPGSYPEAPVSRLLRNDGGFFTDVTDLVAPGLRRIGMVTGAIFSDANADGSPDLLLTLEWGAVRLFRNQGGSFEDRTLAAGLSALLGWWNSIAGGDVDGDGDIDYVVLNFGLNTKYHASRKKPALLYYGELGGAGRRRLIEAEFEGDSLFPVRGKSCSTLAMPSLGEKFETFEKFALASLDEIYGASSLNAAERFEATTLESGVLINDGDARFRFQPLPRLAQASPGFGAALTDTDGDGRVDLYMVQNFFSPQPETGRMAGGLSLLLRGGGDGSFTPVWPHESGLVIPGDAKALTVCDLNEDAWPDFLVTQNDDKVLAIIHRGVEGRSSVAVRLRGLAGNPDAVGALVRFVAADGATQSAEVYAGAGFLSQSTPWLFFGRGAGSDADEIRIRWPDGQSSVHRLDRSRTRIVIDSPIRR